VCQAALATVDAEAVKSVVSRYEELTIANERRTLGGRTLGSQHDELGLEAHDGQRPRWLIVAGLQGAVSAVTGMPTGVDVGEVAARCPRRHQGKG
jgi:hypothetical protein